MKETGAVSFRYNGLGAKSLKNKGRQLLGIMKQRMEGFNLSVYKETKSFPDGSGITVYSNHGYDIVTITVPEDEEEPFIEEAEPASGAMKLWISDDDNTFGWGDPFNGGLGTSLVEEDATLKPYTKVHRVDGVVTAEREVSSDGGDRVWENIEKGERLTWIDEGIEDPDEEYNKHGALWYNGINVLYDRYITMHPDPDNDSWVCAYRDQYEIQPVHIYTILAVALLEEEIDGEELLWVRLITGTDSFDIPASYYFGDNGEKHLELAEYGLRHTLVERPGSQVSFNNSANRVASKPATSNYEWKSWSYATGVGLTEEGEYTYHFNGSSSDGDVVTRDSTSTYPVHLGWIGDELTLTEITIDITSRQMNGWISQGVPGNAYASEPIKFRTTCNSQAETEYVEYPQSQYPLVRRQGQEDFQSATCTLKVSQGGKPILEDRTELFIDDSSYAFDAISSWYLNTWSAKASLCYNGVAMGVDFGIDLGGTPYTGRDSYPDGYTYVQFQDSVAVDIQPITIEWNRGKGDSSSALFLTAIQLQRPLSNPDHEFESDTTYQHTKTVASIRYNSLDYHPANNYLMKLQLCSTGEVDVNFPVPEDAGKHILSVFDLVNDKVETTELETKSFNLILIDSVDYLFTYSVNTSRLSDVESHKTVATAYVEDIWGSNSAPFAGSMKSGRHVTEDVGIWATNLTDGSSQSADPEDFTQTMGSFDFDPYSLLSLSASNNGTIHSSDISHEAKIIYT